MKPVFMSSCTILYIDFTANVAGATVEMFFAELIAFSDTDISVSLCKSKGPIDSFSGLFLTCRFGLVLKLFHSLMYLFCWDCPLVLQLWMNWMAAVFVPVITMFSILKMEASYVAGMLYNTVQDIMRHKYDQHNSWRGQALAHVSSYLALGDKQKHMSKNDSRTFDL